MRLFVAAYDPGVTTGWARWCGPLGTTLGPHNPSLRDVLRAGNLSHGELASRSTNKFEDWTSEAGTAVILIENTLRWMVENEFVTINGDEMAFVFEDFVLRPGPQSGKRSGLASVRMTCYMLTVIRDTHLLMPTIVPQSPSDAMNFLNDDRLKALGWWARGKPHSRDALRHVATYVARRRASERGRG